MKKEVAKEISDYWHDKDQLIEDLTLEDIDDRLGLNNKVDYEVVLSSGKVIKKWKI